jgi:hypothetical protein
MQTVQTATPGVKQSDVCNPHLAKAELVYVVRHVKLLRREGHQIVHVHVALLEGLAGRKVKVSRHLLSYVTSLPDAHSKSYSSNSSCGQLTSQQRVLTLFTDSVPHIWQPSPCWSCKQHAVVV